MSGPETPRPLERYRRLARVLDARYRVPGTPIRFGWDAILGLVPGIGDALGELGGGYGLWVAFRLGAPAAVLLRLLLNVGVDLLVGAVPLLGDLFDVGWRSNQRNVALLEDWLAQPERVRRRSGGLLALLVAALLLLAVAGVVGAAWLVRLLLRALTGP